MGFKNRTFREQTTELVVTHDRFPGAALTVEYQPQNADRFDWERFSALGESLKDVTGKDEEELIKANTEFIGETICFFVKGWDYEEDDSDTILDVTPENVMTLHTLMQGALFNKLFEDISRIVSGPKDEPSSSVSTSESRVPRSRRTAARSGGA